VQSLIFTLRNPYSDSAGNSRSGQTKSQLNRLLCHNGPLIGYNGVTLLFSRAATQTHPISSSWARDSDANGIATTEWYFTVKEVMKYDSSTKRNQKVGLDRRSVSKEEEKLKSTERLGN
jgi:hypothetical protein